MPSLIDTDVVARRFSEAAHTYDTWARPQALIAQRLSEQLPKQAHTILDIGCGTGLMTAIVHDQYPEALIVGIDPAAGMITHCQQRWAGDPSFSFVMASAENYAQSNTFDLVVSSCSFQWFPDKPRAINNIRTSLTKQGTLCVAIPIQGSLPELYTSYEAITHTPMPGLILPDEHVWIDFFKKSGLTPATVSVETLSLQAPNAIYVLNSLKGIGAAPPSLSEEAPISPEEIEAIFDYYQTNFTQSGQVQMSYRMLYTSLS